MASSDSSKRFKLGIFVTSAILFLMAALFLIGQKRHLFGTSFRISATFVDVIGLQVGNSVRLAGVDVGTVEAVTIKSGTSVRVDMIIREDARQFISKDAIASVGSESIIGNKVVVISPGNEDAARVANQDVIHTSIPITIDDILKHLNHTGQNVAAITDDLSHLTGTIRSGHGTLGTLFMDKGFAADVRSTMVNLKDGSLSFKDTIEAAQKSWLLWGSGKPKAEKRAEEKEKEKAKERDKEKANEKSNQDQDKSENHPTLK